MTHMFYEAATLDDALWLLGALVQKNEERGEQNFIFCEDRLTLLAERAVLGAKGGSFLTEVSTFARFLSGDGNKVLSKQGSVMAISALIKTLGDEGEGVLRCFRRGGGQAVYETIAQLSASRVDADMLEQSAAEAEGALADKLRDLALIFRKYTEFLRERGLLDENGYLALLPEKIASGALRGVNVFFFAFPSFTAQAREGLRSAFENAGSVTGIFLGGGAEVYTNEGARAFRKIAEEFGGAQIKKVPCSLGEDALALRDGIFTPESFYGKRRATDAVRIFRAGDDGEEFDTVCALIKKHIMRDGLRYRDIVLLTNGGSSGAEKALRAHAIPYYADKKRKLSSHPFCRFALDILAAKADGGLPASLDAVAANPYFGNGDGYRNYLLKYGGYRGAASKPIRETDEAVTKQYNIQELIACREKMLLFLSLFPTSGTGEKFVSAIEKLYEEADACRGSEALAKQLEEQEMRAESEFMRLPPEIDASRLGSVLKEVRAVAGAQKFNAREFAALLKSGLDSLEVSVLPQYTDAVFVGDLTDGKFARAEVLFCTGLSDDLPRVAQDTAVITDGEIERLGELSVQIEPAIAVVNARARESLALNLCAFKRRLYLSRPLRRGDTETAESEVLAYAEKLFAAKGVGELFPYNATEFDPARLQLIALKQRADDGDDESAKQFAALCGAFPRTWCGDSTPEELARDRERTLVPAAGELYFSSTVSPTLLEGYFDCPYKGFLMRGLRLKEREERTVLNADAGTFVHGVLEETAKKFNAFKDEEECRTYAHKTGERLLASPRFSSLTDTQSGIYTGTRLIGEGVAAAVACYRQLSGSSFRVRETEERIALPALGIRGRADRVDEADGYVRVIDYKTGHIDDSPLSYYTGRKLQLQLYLLAASQDGKAAGAFYFPASDDYTKPGESKFRMSGFFSGEEQVLSLMDKHRAEGEKSEFFGGGGRTEKAMPQSEFDDFLHYALLVSSQAEEEMRAGNIAPSPYKGACDYCKCRGACGFVGAPRKENGVKCKEIARIAKEVTP